LNPLLKEAPFYLLVAASSLFIMCYVVHMMVGGLVSIETEYNLYGVICVIDITAIGLMARDVIKRRTNGGAE
jgi:hypothetical protein